MNNHCKKQNKGESPCEFENLESSVEARPQTELEPKPEAGPLQNRQIRWWRHILHSSKRGFAESIFKILTLFDIQIEPLFCCKPIFPNLQGFELSLASAQAEVL